MKRSLLALSLVLLSFLSYSQSVPFPTDPAVRNSGKLENWGYQQIGTNWNTAQFLPFIYNNRYFRLMPPTTVTYTATPGFNANQPSGTWTNTIPGKKYPLILFFHGAGEKGTDNNNQLSHGGQRHRDAINSGEFPGFAFYPQNCNEVDAKTIIERLIIELPMIDINQIYVHGLSLGGGYSWNFCAAYPTMVAAAFPMSAGGGNAEIPALLYTPFRQAQGALDTNPAPSQSQMDVDWFNNNGGHLEYFLLQGVGHGTWDYMYARSDFFTWFLARKKNTIEVRFDKNLLCTGDPISVDMGFTPGFDAYEWQKDGVTISGQTAAKLIATQYGTYTGRIKNRGVWSAWSDPVVVGTKPPTFTPAITTNGIKSVVLPALDGSTTTELTEADGYVTYVWKNASNQTVNSTEVYSNVPVGSYTATVTEKNGCTAVASPVFNVINANGPNGPDAIADFLGYATSTTAIQLAWADKPSPNFNETGFEVYRATAGAAGPYTLVSIVPADNIGYVDNGLTPNVTYYYKIRPVNGNAAGPVSDVVPVLTQVDNIAPTTPANLAITAQTPTSVSLSWGTSTDNVGVFRYDVYKNGVKTLATTGTTAVIGNLNAGEFYNFVVVARDMTGNISTPSNMVRAGIVASGLSYSYYESATNLTALPTNWGTMTPVETGNTPNIDMTVRNRSNNIAMIWQGNINIPVAGNYDFILGNQDGAALYFDQFTTAGRLINSDGVRSNNASTTATKNFSTVGLHPIWITYFNGNSTSGVSLTLQWKNTAAGQINTVAVPNSAFTPTIAPIGNAPAAPGNLTATAAAFNQINLAWTDNSNNETGFKIYRAAATTGPFSPIATVPSGTTTFQDQSVTGSTTYFYRITAFGDFGESGPSTGVNRGFTYAYYEAPSMTSLSQLTSLVPLATGTSNWPDPALRARNDNMALKWNGKINITTAGTYIFYAKSDDGSTIHIDGALLVSNDANQNNTEKSANKVMTVGWHDIQVQWRKRTSSGNNLQIAIQRTTSPTMAKTTFSASNANTWFFGTEINATTPATPPPPAVPTNVVATNPQPTTILLTWQDNSQNETGFQILRSYKTNTNYVNYATVGPQTTSFTDAGLFANVTYYYKVQAVGPGGSSTSSEASATTANNPPTVTPIANLAVKFGRTADVQVLAADLDNDPMTITVTGLPSFGSVADHGDGSANLHFAPPANQPLGDYPMTVNVQDNHNGLVTTSFVLTVTDKDKPTILPITNPTVSEGTTGSFPIQVQSDFDPSTINWNFTGLPSFATPSIANGLATIALAPGFADSGPYQVTLTVTDPASATSSATFTINVTDVNPNKKISVNIVSSTSASTPWNNMSTNTISALKDGTGTTTAIGAQLAPTNWFGTYTMGAQTGNNSGVFPDNVLKDYYYFGFAGGPNTSTLTISGLDLGLKYTVSLMGSSVFNLAGVTDNGSTVYTIGTTAVSLRVQNNTMNLAKLTNISPASNGTITVTMTKANGTAAGYLNAFTVESVYQSGTAPAAARNLAAALSGSTVNLTWIDSPFNEDGYNVFRATAPGGPFTQINDTPLAMNSTNFSDPNVVDGTTYYYEVQAYNVYGQSPYSNVASVVIPDLPPQITYSGDTNVTPDAFGLLSVVASSDAVLTLSNLPAFAILSPVSDNASDVILLPSNTDTGTYQIYASATDGSGSTVNQTITVTVSQAVLYSISVNFSQSYNATAPWNNTAKVPALNDVFANLVDNNASNSGVSLTLQTAFGGVFAGGPATGNNSGAVPDQVLKEYYYYGFSGGSSDMYMKVSGLNTNNRYRFKFMSSSIFTNNGQITDNGTSTFQIGTKTAQVAVQNNTSNFAVIEDVTTSGTGDVTIHLSKTVSSPAGYINGMIIEALPVDVSKFDPTGLVASGYSKTQVNLAWSDNSPIETGYEIQRSTTGADGSWSVIYTTAADVNTYIDAVPLANKVYYYKVRAVTQSGFSNFSNVAKSGAVAFKVYVNIEGSSATDSPIPWNNTSRFGFTGDIFVGFKDDNGQPTNMRLNVIRQLEAFNTWGLSTGNNSGVFPDNVLLSFWYNNAFSIPGQFMVDGLDQTYGYNFGFLGSISSVTSGAVTPINTNFTIGGTTVTNTNLDNTTVVSYIRNVVPNSNSEVNFTVQEQTGSIWSIWNALVIEGFPNGGNPGGRGAGVVQATGNLKEIRYGMASNSMSIYPNPVETQMTVRVEDSSLGEMNYEFYDLTGRTMGKGKLQLDNLNNEFQMGIDLPAAMYLMKVTYPDGRYEVKKFIKK